MTRLINSATLAALESDSFNIATLVQIDFSSTIRITDWARSVTALSSTWYSSANFIGVGDADAVVGDPILIFDGILTGYSIEDTEEESKVTVQMASHWKDFEKENGRRTNHNSQQLYFAGDEGFEFAPKSIKDLKWGRK